jgi:hypothetical protein
MEKNIISENQVKDLLDNLLVEQASKVNRTEFARIQFKIDELQNSLNETIKELRKVEDSVPEGLKTIANGRLSGVSLSLSNAQKLIIQLKDKIKKYKKAVYLQQVSKDNTETV